MKGKKGFEIVELNITLAFVFVIMLAMVSSFFIKSYHLKYESQNLEAQNIINKLTKEINNVYFLGPGTQKEMYIVERLADGENITIKIYPSEMRGYIFWEQKFKSAPLSTADFNTSASSFTIAGGQRNIKNVDGHIIIE